MNTQIKNVLVGALSGAVASILVVTAVFGFPVKNGSENFFEKLVRTVSENTGGSGSQEELVVNAVKKAKPAVVSVIITKDVPIIEQYYEDPFRDFFGGQSPFQVPKFRENGTEKKEVGGGSGFIVSEDGYIVTNKHVVSDEKAEYTVFLNDGEKYTAKVIARDSLNDIAILKIEAKELPYLKFANSDKLEIGQSAIAIGSPLVEFKNSVSVGVVSGLSRSIVAGDGFGKSEQLEGVIQTDAAINPGNSGGPLLNLKGEVIGVNVAVASAENIGFSLPANLVKAAFDSVKEHGKIVRPYLGVRYAQINEAFKKANNLKVNYGIIVIRGVKPEELAVIPGSPADKAGLKENDIIIEVDGEKITEEVNFARIVAEKKVGEKLKLKVLAQGKEKEIEVTLEEVPE